MKIALTFSSKNGLLNEYKKRAGSINHINEIPQDFFAEGDSMVTINAVINALSNAGHNVTGIEANDQAAEKLDELSPELVFNMAEGLFGDFRESYIPLICERLGLPYTGSDPLTLAIALNKARTKEILTYYGIPNPQFRIFYPLHEIDLDGFEFPGIIKPVSEGSSKGIFNDSVVYDAFTAAQKIREKLLQYNQPVLLEEFLTGREFTVGVWGNGNDVEVLPIVSIDYSELPEGAQPIYSYEAKWIWDTPEKPLNIFECPAKISPFLLNKIEDVVKDTYRVMRIRDWCRVDVRLDDDNIPNVLELNPIPGILPDPKENSCFPKAARTAGYNYVEMLDRIITTAAKRYDLKSTIPQLMERELPILNVG
ncbi:MAG: D-alanine--D-alanine ligase [Calditrichaceae bacterium]